jgi:transposase
MEDADLAARLAVLISIPGIAQATALSLLIEMPELGRVDQSQVASLAGLAPLADDSGTRVADARSGVAAPMCIRRCISQPW